MSPLTSILAKDAQQPPPKVLPNVLAGLTVGLVSLTYSVSLAALIFTGNLSPGFPQGVGSALITSAIVGAIVALHSSFPFAIAGSDSTATAAIALMTAAIAGESQQSHGGAERLFPTVWMAIALSTCLTGLLLYAFGRMRLGRWARFIPYPVMGGFLAGTGLLITCSSFTVMAGVRLGWQELPQLCQAATMMHWLPGVLFAAVSIGVTKIYPQLLILPAILLGAIVGFNLLWQAVGLFVPLNPHGWFLEAVAGDKLWHSWTAASFTQVDWQVLLGHLGASIVLVVVVGRVTESRHLERGETRRWQTLGAGNIVGENSFYLGTPHQTTASAELPTTLYCLSRSHLQTMRQEHPQVVTVFEDFIIRFLVERLMYAHTDIEELL